MGRRPGRAAAKNAAAALKNTPQHYDDDGEDEQMQDVPTSEVGSPQGADEDNEVDEDNEAQESEPASAPATPAPEPVIRKRRLGRPPKNKPPGWEDEVPRDRSESGTPAKRGRGRGGFGRGGGRWARRGGPSHVTQQPIDKEGNMMDVINDEVELPEDEEGETKVDKLGYLKGGRDYRCRTFTVFNRGERLYMLSTEPARCVGFRDSYLFFTKHKRLYKIIIDEDEKRDLIDRELIPHSYKGRAIGIVTARSVFREFGAQIIVGGKRIIDDYEVAKGRADGVVEGEIADPNDIIKPGEEYNKNQYVAWHGASSVYHSGAPTVPLQAKAVEAKKRRVMINDVNWMLEHAREASQFNASLGVLRRAKLNGVYDPHTNSIHYPKTMQPTHAKWEQINDYEIEARRKLLNGHAADEREEKAQGIFTPIKPIYSKNYMIIDTVYESAPSTNLGVPGTGNFVSDLGFNGLASVSDDIKAELPPECMAAFEKTLAKEMEWKSRWSTEKGDAQRRQPIIDKGLVVIS
ncbi:hypothetical protein OIDMADRAFT_103100 [Oidiodendron maius Zn]|uniref:Uncharacterized protein n=1 Tax=Oidiodendron maius (strain Zn) TaxID=913774 RepID=A0A0C3HHK9_OIDMZ|nr:hypothetical protein OIDMADRAFT_103100 [Oidiodendron maius Zn]